MKKLIHICDCCGKDIDHHSFNAVKVTFYLKYEDDENDLSPYCTPTTKKTWCPSCVSRAALQPEMDELKRRGKRRKPEVKSITEKQLNDGINRWASINPPHNPFPEGIGKIGPTDALRSSKEGLGRYDLLDPRTLQNDAKWAEMGAKIHGDNNWRLGIPLKVYLSSAMRHMVKILNGLTDEDHVSAVRWNIMGFAWTLCKIRKGELPESLLKDTVYEKKEKKPSFRMCTPGGPDDPRMDGTHPVGSYEEYRERRDKQKEKDLR